MKSLSSTASESETDGPKSERASCSSLDVHTVREMVRRNSTERQKQGKKMERLDEKLEIIDAQQLDIRQRLLSIESKLADIVDRLPTPPVKADEHGGVVGGGGFQMLSLDDGGVASQAEATRCSQCCGLCWTTCLDMFC